MTEAQAYIEVAERALLAAEGALLKGIQEKAAFLGYHAFESTGGAFCKSRGMQYPRGHHGKINAFNAAARLERYRNLVAALATAYGSLRNLVLYPLPLQNGQVQRPRNVITVAQVRRFLGMTTSLVAKVKPNV